MRKIRDQIPNALTVLRLLLAIFFYFFPYGYRLAVVIIVAVTDVLDGFLARRWEVESEFGRILDPIADRCFAAIMAITFLVETRLTVGQLLLIGLRDIVVVGGAVGLIALGRREEFSRIKTRIPGKVATVIQFVFLGSVLLIGNAIWSLVLATAAISGYAAVDYIRSYFQNAHQPVRVTEQPREA